MMLTPVGISVTVLGRGVRAEAMAEALATDNAVTFWDEHSDALIRARFGERIHYMQLSTVRPWSLYASMTTTLRLGSSGELSSTSPPATW